MCGNHYERHGHHTVTGQTNEGSQQDHREAQAADHAEHAPAGVERPGKADDCKLQHHQPDAAREKKLLQIPRGMPPAVEGCAHSCEKEERGGAEMRYPADKEIKAPRLIDILGLEGDVANEIARVVEGHEDHGEAANDVDGGDSPMVRVCNSMTGARNGNSPFLDFHELYRENWPEICSAFGKNRKGFT